MPICLNMVMYLSRMEKLHKSLPVSPTKLPKSSTVQTNLSYQEVLTPIHTCNFLSWVLTQLTTSTQEAKQQSQAEPPRLLTSPFPLRPNPCQWLTKDGEDGPIQKSTATTLSMRPLPVGMTKLQDKWKEWLKSMALTVLSFSWLTKVLFLLKTSTCLKLSKPQETWVLYVSFMHKTEISFQKISKDFSKKESQALKATIYPDLNQFKPKLSTEWSPSQSMQTYLFTSYTWWAEKPQKKSWGPETEAF